MVFLDRNSNDLLSLKQVYFCLENFTITTFVAFYHLGFTVLISEYKSKELLFAVENGNLGQRHISHLISLIYLISFTKLRRLFVIKCEL